MHASTLLSWTLMLQVAFPTNATVYFLVPIFSKSIVVQVCNLVSWAKQKGRWNQSIALNSAVSTVRQSSDQCHISDFSILLSPQYLCLCFFFHLYKSFPIPILSWCVDFFCNWGALELIEISDLLESTELQLRLRTDGAKPQTQRHPIWQIPLGLWNSSGTFCWLGEYKLAHHNDVCNCV